MYVSNDIKYVGVADNCTDLFEGQYVVPDGITYNSYLIADQKVAVMDSVDAKFADQWIKNIDNVLGDKIPDYLVVSHMEPDHSGSIVRFMQKYQNAKIISNKKVFDMMGQFYGCKFEDRAVVVADGDTFELGKHILNFVFAPMVHWPEVMVTYESTEKVLFSADAFGTFGTTFTADWVKEARRYYMGIVAKFGVPVKNLLQKAAKLDLKTICPLHGPVLKENLAYYLDLYTKWAEYQPEEEGVLIAYASVYGNTKNAAYLLKEELDAKGVKTAIYDLSRSDLSEVVAEAFKYDKLVLASPTYCNTVFPSMGDFLSRLTERDYKNRTVAFIENGSWAPVAAKVMQNALANCKNLTFIDQSVRILSAVNDSVKAAIANLANSLQ